MRAIRMVGWAEIRQRWAQLLTFREGLIRRVQQPFPDIRAALDEAGRD